MQACVVESAELRAQNRGREITERIAMACAAHAGPLTMQCMCDTHMAPT